MPVQAEKQKKIINILKKLPPEKLDAVIDFAEYLKEKKEPLQKIRKKTPPLTIPTFHLGHIAKQAFDRDELYRGYLDRNFD
ncbi:MAG: DUF2281 domain-containing protein [Deltaproteobacteria bacterium]|nr:DUF2281 domain-containing protein [Deltaproteobacteria bacterium]